MKRARSFLLILLALIAVVSSLTARFLYREYSQGQMNRALIAAIKNNDSRAVVSLLDQGADANYPNDLDEPYKSVSWWQVLKDRLLWRRPTETPLLMAVNGSNLPLITALLDHHADVNVRLGNAYSPLWFALVIDDLATAHLLLKYGANVNYGSAQETPLDIAIHNQDVEAVRLLLSYHADINQKQNGDTPLAEAKIFSKSPEKDRIIRLLQQAGAKE